MNRTPAPGDPGRDEDPRPAPPWPAWMDDAAYPAAKADDEDPGDLDSDQDPDNAPPAGLDDDELAAMIAEAREITAEQVRAAEVAARLGHTAVLAAAGAVCAGRRGPGMPGSAQTFPGEYSSPAAGFATGKPLDVAPGCAVLGSFLEDVAGDMDQSRARAFMDLSARHRLPAPGQQPGRYGPGGRRRRRVRRFFLSHMKAFPESGAAPPGWRSPVRA